MEEATQPRKLATIVALDVAGFSARTESDEAKTVAQIALLRPVIEGIAKSHGGRVFNTAGDGFMLEFASALSGVNAALELADECRPRVRVGVHVGEVTVQPNGDLLGHGVNVAARLMAKAEPGSTLISADVCRMIRGPLAERFASRGTVQLDKMAETIEIFAPATTAHVGAAPKLTPPARAWKLPPRPQLVMIGGVALVLLVALVGWHLASRKAKPESATAAAPKATTPVPSAASIAVLPFENLSTDKDNAFFAAGIQDEILTRLSKIGALTVISRTSTAHYASRPENLPQIARELGVANVLEGSVQRQGDAVRINVQLIKAKTDSHIWAEVYDRKLENIFSVQSEIANAIAQALNAKITGREEQVIAEQPTRNLQAYQAYLRGRVLFAVEDYVQGQRQLEEAVRLDGDFAQAWAELARLHAVLFFNNDVTAARHDAARSALDKAVRLKPDAPEVRLAQGYFSYWVERDLASARLSFERLQLDWPSSPEVPSALGLIARRQGRWDASIGYLDRAVALDPGSLITKRVSVDARLITHDASTSLRLIEEGLIVFPSEPLLLARKIAALQMLGAFDKADALLADIHPAPVKAMATIFDVLPSLRLMHDIKRSAHWLDDAARSARKSNLSAYDEAMLNFAAGELQRISGDSAGAKSSYRDARGKLETLANDGQDDSTAADAFATLALTCAGLGDRPSALKYAMRAVELVPVSKDALDGAAYELVRVRVWARFGDRDRAIPALARLLKSPGVAISAAIVRADPDYASLRGDMRFEALATDPIK